MLKIRDYTAADFLAIPPRPEEAWVEGERDFIAPKLDMCSNVALTIYDDETNKVLFVCGFAPLNRGCAEVWWYGGPDVVEHAREIYRITRAVLELHARRLKLHRVQATVEEDFVLARRFVERLGFEFESAMPRFGPNQENFIRYVRFFEVLK